MHWSGTNKQEASSWVKQKKMKNKTHILPPSDIDSPMSPMTSAPTDAPQPVPLVRDETKLEYVSDFVLGIAFLTIGIIAAKR